MLFRCLRLYLTLQAREPLFFPPAKASNTLRGAFGYLFRRVAPHVYPVVFEPRLSSGPSGLADPPRPFVFRSAHLDGLRFSPGDRFEFTMNLFEGAIEHTEFFVRAFALLTEEGLGAPRAAAALIHWQAAPADFDLSLGPSQPIERLAIHFLTPTEIKDQGGLVSRPEFAPMLCRVRDRISTLRACYGPGPLPIDFRAFAAKAEHIALASCQVQQVRVQRRSSRTGETHSLGGFTGCAVYEGPIASFLPFLEAATLTGVGRQTVWGKGQIRLDPNPTTPCAALIR